MGMVRKCPKSGCFVICNGDCLHCERTYFGGKTKMLIDKEDLLKDIDECLVFSGREGHVSAEMRGANKVISRVKMAPAVTLDAIDRVELCKHLMWMLSQKEDYLSVEDALRAVLFKVTQMPNILTKD